MRAEVLGTLSEERRVNWAVGEEEVSAGRNRQNCLSGKGGGITEN